MGRLTGKVALITGAAQGIGAAIARAFVAEGATVLLTDVRDAQGASLAHTLGAAAHYARLDVREHDDWGRAMRDTLDQFGRLDVVVNNAGITGFEGGPAAHDPEHVTLETWRAVFATNLDGVFLGCQQAIRAMRRNTGPAAGVGSIVNISSRSGLVGIPLAAAYAASKAAVRNHTKSVALYCAQQGLRIRCNSVHPAAIMTPMWDAMLGEGPGRAEREAALVRDTPLKRFGTPAEVAHLVVYLASDESAYTTGAEFVLDGGLLAGSAAVPGVSDG
ncbi:MAG: glucose 1-dehydrogenase [Gemmatimonadaceae bacterium]|nr:glucose 1-dehydrogenase [Gemmatimonadaceae bacterium]